MALKRLMRGSQDADFLTVILPTSGEMPNVLAIVRNDWLDDGATFEIIGSVPEILEKDPRDPHVMHYVADIIYGLIDGDVCESLPKEVLESMDSHAQYEYVLAIAQDLAERFIRGGKLIIDMIIRAYDDDFFLSHVIVGTKLLDNGDLMIKYRSGYR